tara:strand:- start:1273 stop:2505 length:1233 start_codon:yes stop_codon:yes gene_type:complete
MLSPAHACYSEDYWRDRCGMPPRGEDYGVNAGVWLRAPAKDRGLPRTLRRMGMSLARLRTRMGHSARPAMSDHFQTAHKTQRPRSRGLAARLFGRSVLLRVSAVLFFVVWLAGTVIVFTNPAPVGASLSEAYMSLAQLSPEPVVEGAAALKGVLAGDHGDSVQFDAMLANYSAANEAALVALRGYLITGSDGFRAEWRMASRRLEAAQTAIEVDSHHWTQGQRLVELREMRKGIAALAASEEMLAGLAASANRYPGLRLYRDETEPALKSAEILIDETLRSVLASNWMGAAARVDTLAHIRSDLANLRASLAIFLPSSARVPPARVTAAYAAFKAGLPALATLRDQVAPEDQKRIDKVRSLLDGADIQLAQVLALKKTPRWDYADYTFKEKAMPLSENISTIIAGWRAEG